MNKAREFDQSVLTELKALLGDRVSHLARRCASTTARTSRTFPYALPDAVVFVKTTEEVRDVVNICRRHRVPMIPYGVGTSLEGHILAVQGGVCIDLSQMNQVLAVHEADLDAVVQAGVTRKQLNEHIKHTGLFFPVDPGADATLGGMAATRASGTNAVRYGTMRENVLSLKVVARRRTRSFKPSRRAKKSAAGYDLTRLFVGSEGTLGIITEVTVRLYPVQEAMSAAVCAFDSVDGCTNTVIQTIQSGIPIARCDIVCEKTVGAINKYKKTNYRVAPTVFFEFHGIEQLGGRAGGGGAGDRQGARRQGLRLGDQARGAHRSSGRRATTPTSPACRSGPARARCRPTSACRSRASPSACARPWRT